MKSMKSIVISGLAAAVFSAALHADAPSTATAEPQAQVQYDPAMLEASRQAALDWLKLVDQGKYNDSWDQGAVIFKLTMPQNEWGIYLNKIRGPLGNVGSREVLDQRVSKDPKGLPKGDYIVMFYDTTFSSGKANELITLQHEDGVWRVMGYYLKKK